MPTPTAIWNPARGVWEVPNSESLICGHSERYSVTWPTSGMTRNGLAYALPTSVPPTADSESSSSLPTPRAGASRSSRKALTAEHWSAPSLEQAIELASGVLPREYESWEEVEGRSRLLSTPTASLKQGGRPQDSKGKRDLRLDLLPTPEAKLATSGPDYARANREGAGGDDLTTTLHRLLPTPTARDHKDGVPTDNVETNSLLGREVWNLLPTPRATDGTKGGPNQRGSSGDLMLPSAVQLLPTPMAGDAKATRNSTATRHTTPPSGIHSGDTLTDALCPPMLPTPRASRGASGTETMYALGARRSNEGRPQGEVLLPTPDASIFNDGQTVEAYQERKARERAKGRNGNGFGTPLAMAVRLLGDDTPPPSSAGSESSAE